jgi:erythromycin esterase-like protein
VIIRRSFLSLVAGVVLGIAQAQQGPVQAVRNAARPFSSEADLQPVVDLARSASFVLIGEASHGTHEFYATRAALSRRLIEQLGFNAVIVEGDWPDAYRVNRFVRRAGTDRTAEQALSSFDKFPEWMWRNTDVRDFATWLRERNRGAQVQAGFYGMDVYSLFRSRDAVLAYLREVDPVEADRAAQRYAGLNNLGDDPQSYGLAVATGRVQSAQGAVVQQFEAIQRITAPLRNSPDKRIADAAFNAEQNARVVMNSEEYFRKMYDPFVNGWNLRDKHMADTIDALADHLRRRDGYARIAVWAHNSHVGDARATDSVARGEWNIGQLTRERHPGDTLLVGFTTHTGTVMATTNWGDPGVVKQVQPSLSGSIERLFHDTAIPAFVLPLRDQPVAAQLQQPMLERAIGVIYLPQTERQSHYFNARVGQQFDALIHFDTTSAVQMIPIAQGDDSPAHEEEPEQPVTSSTIRKGRVGRGGR